MQNDLRTMNELLEDSFSTDERANAINLMPKLLMKLDFIAKVKEEEKELKNQLEVYAKIIGEYKCELYQITKNVETKQTIREKNKTISNDIDKTINEFKQMALNMGDNDLLNKINALENDLQEDKKVSYGKPAKKIKDFNAIASLLQKNGGEINNMLDNIIETKTTETLECKQLKHFNFNNADIESQVNDTNIVQ